MFQWKVSPEQAFQALVKNYGEAIEAEIVRYADSLTDEIAEWMRTEARWTDRTGDARAGLYSDVIHSVRKSVTILFSHGPTIGYSVFLEAHPYYGIIADAIDHWGPVVFRGVQEIVEKGKKGRR